MEMNLGKRVPFGTRLLQITAVIIPLFLIAGAVYYFTLPVEPQMRSIRVEVPYGQQERVDLPDGSIIWLNAGSALEYGVPFETTGRMVKLYGEGYFSVTKKDAAHPFIVETEHLAVRVLGTEFNISSYPEDETTMAILDEGSLEIKTSGQGNFRLAAGQQLIYDHRTMMSTVSEVESGAGSAWKAGHMIFTGATPEKLFRVLARKFDVQFVVPDEMKEKDVALSAKFVNDEHLNEILYVLQDAGGFYYQINEKEVVISEK